MDKDIEMLKDKIQVFRYMQSTLDEDEKELYAEDFGEEEIQAIENLIKRNKELEEDKKYKDKIIKGLGLDTIPRIINSFNEMINKYYISRNVIRDLIVERQFELQQEFKDFKDDVRLNTLQELCAINENAKNWGGRNEM